MFQPMAQWPARQWVRIIVIAAIVLALLWILSETITVLLPFLLGLFIAYLILPAVDRLDGYLRRWISPKASRIIAILAVYLLAALLIAALFTYLVPIVVQQVEDLINNREQIINTIVASLAGLRERLMVSLPEPIRDFVLGQLDSFGRQLESGLVQGVTGILTGIGNTVVAIAGFVVIPFWLIYVLYDAGKFRRGIIGLIPESVRPDVLNIAQAFDDIVAAYVRGQLIVAALTGALTGLGLAVIGVNFAVLLGVITAVLDLIPTLGPILAAIPTVLIAALEEPILGLWALLVLVGAQQIESIFLGPRIVGDSVRVSPALIIVLLVIAGDLFGLLGLLLVVPLAAFLRDTVRYLMLRTAREPVSPDGALHQVRKARLGD